MIPAMKPIPTDDPALLLAKHVSRTLRDMADAEPDAVEAAALALVAAERSGHACVPLEELAAVGVSSAQLLASGLVSTGSEIPATGVLPLVLDLDRLYFQRLHDYEHRLAQKLGAWLRQPDLPVDEAVLSEVLAQAGMKSEPGEPSADQARAVDAACRRPLAIISGGPGTGKTRTAAVLLLALLRLHPGMRYALAAPTGKAAARLQQSIEDTHRALGLVPAEEETPPEGAPPRPSATTLHRLLGASADGRRFRHGPGNPLPHDLVLVDEASMVDLAAMCRLVSALKPTARLVLLGDKDQLASVDAGYVLGDICEAAAASAHATHRPTAVELRTNFRFAAQSPIGQLATCIRQGDTTAALATLRALQPGAEIEWRAPATERDLAPLVDEVFQRVFAVRFQAQNAEAAVDLAARFQILCAVRRGPFGVEGLNAAIENRLERLGRKRADQTWYPSRQILVTANDAQLGLFNGDLGVAWPDAKGQLRVWFRLGAELHAFSPAQLPAHATAFAITVHKSQGSEFDEVLLVLPPNESPVCTRELVYTGLTRARQDATLWATEPALATALARKVRRASGLAARLA